MLGWHFKKQKETVRGGKRGYTIPTLSRSLKHQENSGLQNSFICVIFFGQLYQTVSRITVMESY